MNNSNKNLLYTFLCGFLLCLMQKNYAMNTSTTLFIWAFPKEILYEILYHVIDPSFNIKKIYWAAKGQNTDYKPPEVLISDNTGESNDFLKEYAYLELIEKKEYLIQPLHPFACTCRVALQLTNTLLNNLFFNKDIPYIAFFRYAYAKDFFTPFIIYKGTPPNLKGRLTIAYSNKNDPQNWKYPVFHLYIDTWNEDKLTLQISVKERCQTFLKKIVQIFFNNGEAYNSDKSYDKKVNPNVFLADFYKQYFDENKANVLWLLVKALYNPDCRACMRSIPFMQSDLFSQEYSVYETATCEIPATTIPVTIFTALCKIKSENNNKV